MNSTMMVSLVSPLVAVAIAVWSFRRTSRSDRLRAFFQLQERYLDVDVRRGRKLAHNLTTDTLQNLAPEDSATIGHMLAVLNSIAIAAEGGYVDRRLLAQAIGRSYSSAVRAARPYIDHVESVRGFRPFPFAERMAAELARTRDATS